jgi:hypothetical protein
MVGVSRENVNRALSGLAADGTILIQAGSYVLPELDRLRTEISDGLPILDARNRRLDPDL